MIDVQCGITFCFASTFINTFHQQEASNSSYPRNLCIHVLPNLSRFIDYFYKTCLFLPDTQCTLVVTQKGPGVLTTNSKYTIENQSLSTFSPLRNVNLRAQYQHHAVQSISPEAFPAFTTAAAKFHNTSNRTFANPNTHRWTENREWV